MFTTREIRRHYYSELARLARQARIRRQAVWARHFRRSDHDFKRRPRVLSFGTSIELEQRAENPPK